MAIMARVNEALFDAGPFIGALLSHDSRHAEAFPLVEEARLGRIAACTTTGILSEVYATLTWQGGQPPHSPADAARVIRELVELPSYIRILPDSVDVSLLTLELAERHNLKARRVHDARHAATALVAGIVAVYTYDAGDWQVFAADGITVAGPPSMLRQTRST